MSKRRAESSSGSGSGSGSSSSSSSSSESDAESVSNAISVFCRAAKSEEPILVNRAW